MLQVKSYISETLRQTTWCDAVLSIKRTQPNYVLAWTIFIDRVMCRPPARAVVERRAAMDVAGDPPSDIDRQMGELLRARV